MFGENRKSQYLWIKFNVDEAGFYRVTYDAQLLSALTNAINENQLLATNRYRLLEFSSTLYMASKQTLSSLLLLMDAYRKESEYTVMSHIISISYKVVYVAADAAPELLDDIKLFFINLLKLSAENLGWDSPDSESHSDAMLRGELLTALAHFRHEYTLTEAVQQFSTFLNNRKTSLLPSDITKAAYVAVMQSVTTSNMSGYVSLLRIYRETDQSEERVRILGSLATCPDRDINLEVLNFVLTPELRNQDAAYGVRVSWEGREIAWTSLKKNWDYISKTWGSGSLLTRFVDIIVPPFCSEEKGKEVEDFFASQEKPAIAKTLKQSLERVRNNADWLDSISNDKALGAT